MAKKILIILFFITPAFFIIAASIDTNYKYAWGETLGWVNFAPTYGNVQVFDNKLTGYAWSMNYGWINLSPLTAGVTNDGDGNLAGYAWGENIGWIDFSNVKINPFTGEFSGYAIVVRDDSKINFDCSDCKVKTLWRKATATSEGSRVMGSYSRDYNFNSSAVLYINSSTLEILKKNIEDLFANLNNFVSQQTKRVQEVTRQITKKIKRSIPYFREQEIEALKTSIDLRWNVIRFIPLKLTYTIYNQPMVDFTKIYLPENIRLLALKLPQVNKIFQNVGLYNLLNLEKLKIAKIHIPTLREVLNVNLPLAKLSLDYKDKIPSDLVFVKTHKDMFDIKPFLIVDENNEILPAINVLNKQELLLVYKPSSEVKSLKGYLLYRGSATSWWQRFINVIFAKNVEYGFKVYEFQYFDDDNDGIYTAKVQLPSKIYGKFEIITVVEYKTIDLGVKELRLITVIDPEGYVFERIFGREARIANAKVTLYSFNYQKQSFEIWDAKKFLQTNPQFTDQSGNYSFLVPEGKYYLTVEADGYYPYKSNIIEAREGEGIHINIELKSYYWFLYALDWKLVIIIILIVIIFKNFYVKIKLKLKNKFNE
ncbi:MAG: hypothetical protein KatS3mg097_061 [Candidatus Parcubacteria bacterium]|nr:MAG: hypothetical protein KatS3mg097_061 [Candidatus Parcubacteria bacterium]